MQTLSISDIQRNLHKLDNIDIVQIVDKKRNKIKGYFLSEKYTDMIKKIFDAQRTRSHKAADEFMELTAHPTPFPDPSIDLTRADEDFYRDFL